MTSDLSITIFMEVCLLHSTQSFSLKLCECVVELEYITRTWSVVTFKSWSCAFLMNFAFCIATALQLHNRLNL